MTAGPSSRGEMVNLDEASERIAVGLLSARVRMRALLELLEEKGLLISGEFDTRAQQLWDRDYDELAQELMSPAPEEEPALEEGQRSTPPPADPAAYAAALFQNFVAESVSSRIRMRALLDLLEAKGILGPNEFDERAEQIWNRDYEELALEFYRKSY